MEVSPADSPGVEGKRDDLDLGTAGAGARREHERGKSRREAKTREDHPHLGGLLLRFQDEPQREKAWRDGAVGEEAVASHLAKTCPDVVVLHDRRMPRSRANIDHIAIAPSGVFVIDAKRYKGKSEVRKPLFGDAKLVIRGRDKTKLVDGLKRQVERSAPDWLWSNRTFPSAGASASSTRTGRLAGVASRYSGPFLSTAFRCSTRASFRSTSSGPDR
jgi:hypothetical protein